MDYEISKGPCKGATKQGGIVLIALLPMKSHSERVPKKNIKLLNGQPLFYYVADTLRVVNQFEFLAINTDCPQIADLALARYGEWVRIIDRPIDLIGDNVSMNLIIAHDIGLLGKENHYFQTHSTNPLITGKTINSAIQQYQVGILNKSFDSLFSVNALRTRLFDKALRPVNHNPLVLGRTQDLDIIYEENSNFYIFSGKSFNTKQHRIGSKPDLFVMDRNNREGLDIDDKSDWDLVEMIIKCGHINA